MNMILSWMAKHLILHVPIGDPIDQMVDAFSQITNLKSLDIGNNRITSLHSTPIEIFLQTLESLYLDMNRLTNLPAYRRFTFSENIRLRLQSVNKSTGNNHQFTKSEDLRVAHNQLMTLPDTIGNLRSFETLYLEGIVKLWFYHPVSHSYVFKMNP